MTPDAADEPGTVRLKYIGNYKSYVPGFPAIHWAPGEVKELSPEVAKIIYNDGNSLFEMVIDEPKSILGKKKPDPKTEERQRREAEAHEEMI
jgi:hypothetical protein